MTTKDPEVFNCVTRAPLLYFIRSWVALFFKVVSESVSLVFYLHWFHPWNLSQLLYPTNPNNGRFLLLQIPINEQQNIQKLDEQIKRNYKQIHTKQTVAPPASRGQWRLSSNLEITLCQSKSTVPRKCTNPFRQQIMQVCTERNTMCRHDNKYTQWGNK